MNTTLHATPLQLDDLPVAPAAAVPELFAQLGLITRRLQNTLGQLDAMPRLQQSAQDLPDARGRLGDIAARSFAAADKVLTAVEQAKQERARIAAAVAQLASAGAAASGGAPAAALAEIELAAARIDAHLTDIMVAQDFHDLSGQMLAKVVGVAIELEGGLLQLLRGPAAQPGPTLLRAPAEVAHSQREVDELLASHGF